LAGLLSSEGAFSAGLVAAVSGIGDDTTKLQISAAVQPGNSGGPLLDENGALAGVVVAKLDAVKVFQITGNFPESINFAIKGEVLRLLLDTFGLKYSMSRSVKKLEARMLAEKAKSFTYSIACR
jgi:S1-C subfamily serine protease